MKKKVLILIDGSIHDRKGLLNAELNRISHLQHIADYDIDVFMLSSYNPWHMRMLFKLKKTDKVPMATINGVTIKIFWYPFMCLDYILSVKLHKRPLFKSMCLNRVHKMMKKYDFVNAHSTECGEIAMKAKRRYGIPYSVTWHGSDIHTVPNTTPYMKTLTCEIIKEASCNLYVSKALQRTGMELQPIQEGTVLYNGRNKQFKRYDDDRRLMLRSEYNVSLKRVVAFCGSLIDIKNVLKIPAIFKHVYSAYPESVFWIIGDGKRHEEMARMSEGLPIRFWGNLPPEQIPDMMNCIDVLILPSQNEGLPLVTVEALSCGCHVVGSNVGGIPESIGEENCVDLTDPDFENVFATKILGFLQNPSYSQPLDVHFDWELTAQKENVIIHNFL